MRSAGGGLGKNNGAFEAALSADHGGRGPDLPESTNYNRLRTARIVHKIKTKANLTFDKRPKTNAMWSRHLKLSMIAILLAVPLAAPCVGKQTLAWIPSPSAGVAGINLCWGTSSGVYTFTNTYSNTETQATISNLVAHQVYYFAAQSFSSNGTVSVFSNEACFTNELPGGLQVFGEATNNGGGGDFTGAASNSETHILGIPPTLKLTSVNGEASMVVGGTVGASFVIQVTANLQSFDSWVNFTNIILTNIATASLSSNQTSKVQDIMDLAFVPAAQTIHLPITNSTPWQFFRAVVPYDYAVLANAQLSGQGYNPRLVVVNMAGVGRGYACYVSEAGGIIHYDRTNYALQFDWTGPTIRQIATTLANSLNADWTSASEVSYSNGLSQVLATVIKTQPAISDPVPGY